MGSEGGHFVFMSGITFFIGLAFLATLFLRFRRFSAKPLKPPKPPKPHLNLLSSYFFLGLWP